MNKIILIENYSSKKGPFSCFVLSLSKQLQAIHILKFNHYHCTSMWIWVMQDAAAWATPWTHFTSPRVCPLCPLHTHSHQWSMPVCRPLVSTAPPVWKTRWDSPASVQGTGPDTSAPRVTFWRQTLLHTHNTHAHTHTAGVWRLWTATSV